MNFEKYKRIEFDRLFKKENLTYPKKLCRFIFKKFNFRPNMKILDVGCGQGIQLKEFYKLGMSVYGTDVNDSVNFKEIKYTKMRNDNKLPFEDESFDFVFSKSVIEHIHDPTLFLSEVMRVLKKGGSFIVLTPDWKSQMYNFFDDPTHVHPYSIKSLRMVLEMNGFKNITSEIFVQLPFLWGRLFFLKYFLIIFNLIPEPIFESLFLRFKIFRFAREKMILGHCQK